MYIYHLSLVYPTDSMMYEYYPSYGVSIQYRMLIFCVVVTVYLSWDIKSHKINLFIWCYHQFWWTFSVMGKGLNHIGENWNQIWASNEMSKIIFLFAGVTVIWFIIKSNFWWRKPTTELRHRLFYLLHCGIKLLNRLGSQGWTCVARWDIVNAVIFARSKNCESTKIARITSCK